jgi:hypothetical protein
MKHLVPLAPLPLALAVLQVLAASPGLMPAAQAAPISRTSYRVPASLGNVSNRAVFTKQLPLSGAQKAMIARNSFVVSPTTSRQMFHVYEENDYKNVPSLVTADSVLHLYHIFFDFSLRKVESERLLPIVKRLTTGMLAASLVDHGAATDAAVKDAALRNVAFFGLADRLLGGNAPLPEAARALVAQDLALANAHEGFGQGAIFPYKIDYSQFAPRGHYTRSEDLKKFFRAMMLYGLSPFAQTDDTPANRGPMLQGLLWTRAMYGKKLDADWVRVYEPTAFFVGAADDLTPAEWRAMSHEAFGVGANVNDFADADKMEAFVAKVEAARKPSIAPKFASQMGKDLGPGADVVSGPLPPPGAQLRFMGQRYVPDSEVLQVLSEPGDRPFPSGLDVMAAFGSPRAAALLDKHADIYNAQGWTKYKSERTKITQKFANLPRETWNSNLYYGWLFALRALNEAPPTGAPAFMRNTAWQDKSLWSALGSWAQLRHDTLLYVKQSAVELGGGEDERPFVKGYVEPNVAFYDRLFALTRASKDGLKKRDLLPQDLYEKFGDFEVLLSQLRTISRKELAGQALTRSEYETIRFIGGQLEGLTLRVMGDGNGSSYWSDVPETDRDMATVA